MTQKGPQRRDTSIPVPMMNDTSACVEAVDFLGASITIFKGEGKWQMGLLPAKEHPSTNRTERRSLVCHLRRQL